MPTPKRLRPGDPIPGSTLLRSYCSVCGEPIRVPPPEKDKPLSDGPCNVCRAAAHPGYGKPGGDAHVVGKGDALMWGENAIRHMEDD